MLRFLFRHGDRAPTFFYPKDPFKNRSKELWPDGPKELTSVGKKQHFEFGKFLRKRYDEFLSETYHYQDIKVLSSDVDRCFMSAAANLAGLFPPKGNQLWNPDLPWMPIPIHMIPRKDDPWIGGRKPCPRYKSLLDAEAKKCFDESYKEHKGYFDYLIENAGFKINSLNQLRRLWDGLFVESYHNQTLPEWTKSVFPTKMEHFVELEFATYSRTYELARFAAGPMIDLIASHFENITRKIPATAKFLMLSGHDNTLFTLSNALNISDHRIPGYATTLIFELRSRQKSLYINIFYKNETYGETLIERTLEGCEFNCEFGKFRKIVEPLRVDVETWDDECSKFGPNNFENSGYIYFYGIILNFLADVF
ncbi:hypothetical protein JTB14_009789 [Gonioctena quinquepunctata]|nr:hypothetical protein JTB14_009789 [Gonioctena quinquepunctata]